MAGFERDIRFRMLKYFPAVLLAQQNRDASISELVLAFRFHGLGGEVTCKKLVHRLAQAELLNIEPRSNGDRREKIFRLTERALDLLREVHSHLQSASQDIVRPGALRGHSSRRARG